MSVFSNEAEQAGPGSLNAFIEGTDAIVTRDQAVELYTQALIKNQQHIAAGLGKTVVQLHEQGAAIVETATPR